MQLKEQLLEYHPALKMNLCMVMHSACSQSSTLVTSVVHGVFKNRAAID